MQEIFSALNLTTPDENIITTPTLPGNANLPSRFCVSELANSSIYAVGLAMAELIYTLGITDHYPPIAIDQRLASFWFSFTYQPIGWETPPAWDAIAGDYQTRNGWIKLHTNLAHHRQAALDVLKTPFEKEAVAKACREWDGDELEQAIVLAGGVAAKMRSREEWLAHPQGKTVASEPLIDWKNHTKASNTARAAKTSWQPTRKRPLHGLKILDLTRVLAGPVATRTLAGFGAQVLRIDPPGWDENIVVPEITLGKNCAFLDLKTTDGRTTFEELLAQADLLIHGYRPGALDALGLTQDQRHALNPDLLEISLCAYGWSGPWAKRRGFDSLVQMSSGIAHAGMNWQGSDKPYPLPVQALDFATGYLMAASAIRLLTISLSKDNQQTMPRQARLSLARTAHLLATHLQNQNGTLALSHESDDFLEKQENMPWGKAKRLRPPLAIEGTPMRWDSPACKFGSSPACWR